MLRIDHVIRPWKESGALNSQINLYGFWNEQAFLDFVGNGLAVTSPSRRVRPLWEIVPELAPREGEVLIDKSQCPHSKIPFSTWP